MAIIQPRVIQSQQPTFGQGLGQVVSAGVRARDAAEARKLQEKVIKAQEDEMAFNRANAAVGFLQNTFGQDPEGFAGFLKRSPEAQSMVGGVLATLGDAAPEDFTKMVKASGVDLTQQLAGTQSKKLETELNLTEKRHKAEYSLDDLAELAGGGLNRAKEADKIRFVQQNADFLKQQVGQNPTIDESTKQKYTTILDNIQAGTVNPKDLVKSKAFYFDDSGNMILDEAEGEALLARKKAETGEGALAQIGERLERTMPSTLPAYQARTQRMMAEVQGKLAERPVGGSGAVDPRVKAELDNYKNAVQTLNNIIEKSINEGTSIEKSKSLDTLISTINATGQKYSLPTTEFIFSEEDPAKRARQERLPFGATGMEGTVQFTTPANTPQQVGGIDLQAILEGIAGRL